MAQYRHLVSISEERLTIHRVFSNGREELLTETALPQSRADENWDAFCAFAKELGENILMDSEVARRFFSL